VIHINHNKRDNSINNLKWVTQKEANEHQNYNKVAYQKNRGKKTKGLKLNVRQVKTIKSILANPKRKLTHKQIADRFKITPMTIYRIKSGENCGSI
jgi:DNA-directed RNA polymerase specialized sigma subunit